MKYSLALATLLSTAALVTVATAAGFPPSVRTIDHAKMAAGFVKGERVLEDEGLIVIAQRVVGRGSEMHDNTNHVFIIVEGEATFVTGGTMVEPKNTAPGQIRAKSVNGGQTYHLTKGDVITVPAKTPHWFKDVPTQTIAYYAVNLEP